MKFPGHADKKSFKIFLYSSLGAFVALAIPLFFSGRDAKVAAAKEAPEEPATVAEAASPKTAKKPDPTSESEPPAMPAVTAPAPGPAVFTVADYEPSRDPTADLAETIERATAENKRILLLVGGSWCLWSRALDVYILENEETAEALARDYLIMKVNYSQSNENRIFIQQFEDIVAIPHFFVLGSNGDLLHSQPTGPLEKGLAYDTESFLAFLSEWTPDKDPVTVSEE